MSVIRRVFRPMLASIFVLGGVEALRRPRAHAEQAEPVIGAIGSIVPAVDEAADENVVRANAAVQIGAGLLLATNRAPRLSSAALAATLVPTTFAGHRFWEEDDPAKAAEQRVHFTKNMSLLGGLAIAAMDTEGKPGVAWRAEHAADHAKGVSELAAAGVVRSARDAKREARVKALEAQLAAAKATDSSGSSLPSKQTLRRVGKLAKAIAGLEAKTAKAAAKAEARALKQRGRAAKQRGRAAVAETKLAVTPTALDAARGVKLAASGAKRAVDAVRSDAA